MEYFSCLSNNLHVAMGIFHPFPIPYLCSIIYALMCVHCKAVWSVVQSYLNVAENHLTSIHDVCTSAHTVGTTLERKFTVKMKLTILYNDIVQL